MMLCGMRHGSVDLHRMAARTRGSPRGFLLGDRDVSYQTNTVLLREGVTQEYSSLTESEGSFQAIGVIFDPRGVVCQPAVNRCGRVHHHAP